jgi:hypothetical protein
MGLVMTGERTSSALEDKWKVGRGTFDFRKLSMAKVSKLLNTVTAASLMPILIEFNFD